MKIKKPKIKISCKNCYREFRVFPCRKDTAKFCSHKCYSDYIKGRILSESWREKIGLANSISQVGKKRSIKTKEKMSLVRLGKTYEEIYGKEKADELKKKSSLKRKNISYEELYGIKKSREIKLKLRVINLGKPAWNDAKNLVICKLCNKRFKSPPSNKAKFCSKLCFDEFQRTDLDYKKEQAIKIIKSTNKRPTSYETKISELCIEYNLPFIYCGNGTFIIGYKNPDFVDKKQRIVIEVYSDFFKRMDYGSCENYEKQRSEYFAKYGYKTIFINEKTITSKNWEELCLNKIKNEI